MRRILGEYGFAIMPEPLDAYGEQQPALRLDLRGLPESVQQETHFMTLIALQDHLGGGYGAQLVVRDMREDVIAVYSPPVARYDRIWDRIPVRGPVQVEVTLRNVQDDETAVGVGYVEDDDPDIDHTRRPLQPVGAPPEYAPARLQDDVTGHVLGDVPDGTWNVSLAVHAPAGADTVDLHYLPAGATEPVATIRVKGGQRRFVPVLDRIPVRGPGRILVDAQVSSPVTMFGSIGA